MKEALHYLDKAQRIASASRCPLAEELNLSVKDTKAACYFSLFKLSNNVLFLELAIDEYQALKCCHMMVSCLLEDIFYLEQTLTAEPRDLFFEVEGKPSFPNSTLATIEAIYFDAYK